MILRIFVILGLVFLLFPLIVITLFSFNDSISLTFPLSGFSLRWYEELFQNRRLFGAFKTSLLIAGISTIVTMVLGLGFSLLWLRLQRTKRSILELICIVPIALPGLFIGISLLIFFAEIKLNQSWITIVLAHILLALPILAITMRARLVLYDPSLNEAARDLGASELQTLTRVTLPILAPFLFACGLLTFAISFDEFVLTFFVAGTETTVPLFVWSMMRQTVTPVINAISTLTLLVTGLALLLAWLVTHVRRQSDLGAQQIISDDEA